MRIFALIVRTPLIFTIFANGSEYNRNQKHIEMNYFVCFAVTIIIEDLN